MPKYSKKILRLRFTKHVMQFALLNMEKNKIDREDKM